MLKATLLSTLLLISSTSSAAVTMSQTGGPATFLRHSNGVTLWYIPQSELPKTTEHIFTLSPEDYQWIESFKLVNPESVVTESKIPAVQELLKLLKHNNPTTCLLKNTGDETKSFVVQIVPRTNPDEETPDGEQIRRSDLRIYGTWPKAPCYIEAFLGTCVEQLSDVAYMAKVAGLGGGGALATLGGIFLLNKAYQAATRRDAPAETLQVNDSGIVTNMCQLVKDKLEKCVQQQAHKGKPTGITFQAIDITQANPEFTNPSQLVIVAGLSQLNVKPSGKDQRSIHERLKWLAGQNVHAVVVVNDFASLGKSSTQDLMPIYEDVRANSTPDLSGAGPAGHLLTTLKPIEESFNNHGKKNLALWLDIPANTLANDQAFEDLATQLISTV